MECSQAVKRKNPFSTSSNTDETYHLGNSSKMLSSEEDFLSMSKGNPNNKSSLFKFLEKRIQNNGIKIPLHCCKLSCKYKCQHHVSEEQRQYMFEVFCLLNDSEKLQFIYMTTDQPCGFYNKSKPSVISYVPYKYYLFVNKKRIRVCKCFYFGTIHISPRILAKAYLLKQLKNVSLLSGLTDMQTLVMRAEVKRHIESFPCVELCCHHASTSKKYLSSCLNISRMYDMYFKYAKHKKIPIASFKVYKSIFKSEFNLLFHDPKGTGCELCEVLKVPDHYHGVIFSSASVFSDRLKKPAGKSYTETTLDETINISDATVSNVSDTMITYSGLHNFSKIAAATHNSYACKTVYSANEKYNGNINKKVVSTQEKSVNTVQNNTGYFTVVEQDLDFTKHCTNKTVHSVESTKQLEYNKHESIYCIGNIDEFEENILTLTTKRKQYNTDEAVDIDGKSESQTETIQTTLFTECENKISELSTKSELLSENVSPVSVMVNGMENKLIELTKDSVIDIVCQSEYQPADYKFKKLEVGVIKQDNNKPQQAKRKYSKTSDCSSSCMDMCKSKVQSRERKEIFETFHCTFTESEKETFICSTVKLVTTKTGYNYKKFYLFVQNELIPVCKQFYLRTLNISYQFITEVFQKKKKEIKNIATSRKVSSCKIRRINVDAEESCVKQHILSFPVFQSTYYPPSSNRKWLPPNLTVEKMYLLYCTDCKSKNIVPVNLEKYEFIFKSVFSLDFFKPEINMCNVCQAFEKLDMEGEISEKECAEYKLHTASEAETLLHWSQDQSSRDFLILPFDLQTVLCPQVGNDTFCYKRKLNIHSLTAIFSQTKQVYYVLWPEVLCTTTRNDVANALRVILENSVKERRLTELLIWADSGNRNPVIVITILHFLQANPNVKSVTIKYSTRGHSFTDIDVNKIHKRMKEKVNKLNFYSTPGFVEGLRKCEPDFRIFEVSSSDHKDFESAKMLLDCCLVPFHKIRILHITLDKISFKTSFDSCEVQTARVPEHLPQVMNSTASKVSEQKMKDIISMYNSMPLLDQNYYRGLFGI